MITPSLTIPIINPGKIGREYNIFLIACAMVLLLLVAGALLSIHWLIYSATAGMLICFFWGMSMEPVHQKAGTLRLEADHFTITRPGVDDRTFWLRDLPEVLFYIDGAHGDIADHQAGGNPLAGAEADQRIANGMRARSGFKNRLEFEADGLQQVFYVRLYDRNMTALNTVILRWANRHAHVRIEDRSGRGLPYPPAA